MTPQAPREATHYADWIGREAALQDRIGATPVRALAATLDRDDAEPSDGDPLPPLWHWLFFLPHERQSALGDDGHARRGSFLPPVALPRRMWAGGRLDFLRPLRIGETATRVSRIADVSTKTGRSGALVFVRVVHEVSNQDGLALRETHDIVYRDAARPGAAPPAEAPPASVDEQFKRTVVPDPVLLFRYSALTFNGHRIHYDRSYVHDVEGYPGLVVHGPLIATLLADLLRRERPDFCLRGFTYKAVQPLFDTAPFTLCGRIDAGERSASVWARDADGRLAMHAEAARAA